jgi:hypothetical protein
MPIVATGEFDLVDMVVLLCFIRPIQALFAGGREHGRTIPLAAPRAVPRLRALLPHCSHSLGLTATAAARLRPFSGAALGD